MQQGDRFGSYVLEEKIAAGGMAEIFRARRIGVAGFARQVCIKRILPALCTDKAFVDMFVDEARTGAQLRHGNIVAIDDFGEVDGRYFLCMELVSGVDLSRLERLLLAQGLAVPASLAVYIAGEVLRALDYAHRKLGPDGKPLGVIHRDVSPQNVLVSFAGEVKLTDFGIARASSRLHQTVGNVVKGKLGYMSPEQIYGHALDARLDLFALGVVLFELLAGQRPFRGRNEAEVVAAILHGTRAPLRSLRGDVPPALETLIDRLLARDRDARYPSASAALGDLAALQTGTAGARAASVLMASLFPEHASAIRGDDAGFASDPLVRIGPRAEADEATTAPDATDPTTDPFDYTVAVDEPEATRIDARPSRDSDVPEPGEGVPVTAISATVVAPAVPDRETSPHDATRTMIAQTDDAPRIPAATGPARVGPRSSNGSYALIALVGAVLAGGAVFAVGRIWTSPHGPDASAPTERDAAITDAVAPGREAVPSVENASRDRVEAGSSVDATDTFTAPIARVDAGHAVAAPIALPDAGRSMHPSAHPRLLPSGHITTEPPF